MPFTQGRLYWKAFNGVRIASFSPSGRAHPGVGGFSFPDHDPGQSIDIGQAGSEINHASP
jgi:hypothetical protein